MRYYQVHKDHQQKLHLAINKYYCQWLGTGYYLWEHIIPSVLWSKRIPESKIYTLDFNISDNQILDLIQNMDDLLWLFRLYKKIKTRVAKINYKQDEIKRLTLSYLIECLHQKGLLEKEDFLAIRFSTPYNADFCNINVDKKEKLYFIPKIQVCLFEFALEKLGLQNSLEEYSLSDEDNKMIGDVFNE